VDYLRTRLLLHLRLAIRRKTPRGADYPSILKRTLELFEGFRCVSVFFQKGERPLVEVLLYLLQLSRHLSRRAGHRHLPLLPVVPRSADALPLPTVPRPDLDTAANPLQQPRLTFPPGC